MLNPALAQGRLAGRMSSYSQSVYGAQWMAGLEYDLWSEVTGATVNPRYGLTPEEKQELMGLFIECGGWIMWSDANGGETWIPAGVWVLWWCARGLSKEGCFK